MNRRLTPLALAAAVGGANLGRVVAGGGELLGGGPSQAAPTPGGQDGRHGTTIVVRGRPELTARAEATQREDHPDRQRCDRRAVDRAWPDLARSGHRGQRVADARGRRGCPDPRLARGAQAPSRATRVAGGLAQRSAATDRGGPETRCYTPDVSTGAFVISPSVRFGVTALLAAAEIRRRPFPRWSCVSRRAHP